MTQNHQDQIALTADEVARAVPTWQAVDATIAAGFRFANFVEVIGFVDEVAAIAEAHNHHPDIDIRYNRVFFTLSSHDVKALTARDVRLARAISELADRFGAEQVAAEH